MDLVKSLQDLAFISKSTQEEIKNGGFVILLDKGYFYHNQNGVTRCFSEHASAMPVYDIVGTSGTILVGVTEHGHTWLQWERSKCMSPQHVRDWCRYLCSRKNQGPFGESAYTESNPIRLNVKNEINF